MKIVPESPAHVSYTCMRSEIADANKLFVIPDLAGHGIGARFHMPPHIYHICILYLLNV